jgi:hypothetical protein
LLPIGKKIKFYDNSKTEADMTLTVPFDITISSATFADTLAFSLPGLRSLAFLDTVQIRTAFSSSIPTDFNIQLVLYNSLEQKEVGELFMKPVHIKGSYDGLTVPSEINYISVTKDRLKDLQQADKMILRLSLLTDEKHCPFNIKNAMKARVGAKIKTQF